MNSWTAPSSRFICPSGMEPKRENTDFQGQNNYLSRLRFIRVIRSIRGENAIAFLTADSTDFTDIVAGKATHDASTFAATWRCPVRVLQRTIRALRVHDKKANNVSVFEVRAGRLLWVKGLSAPCQENQ